MNTIVIGAGHNGLTAALMLARAGRKVLVLEARDSVGGIAAGAEFAPGYHHRGILHDTDCVRPALIKLLGLKTEPAPPVHAVRADGSVVRVDEDPGHAAYRAFIETMKPFAASVLDRTPPSLRQDASLWDLAKPAMGLRRLGRDDMMRLLAVGPTAVDDWLQNVYADPAVRAAACFPALVGAWAGPRSPLTTANLLLREALAGPEVVGGSAALVTALVAACKAAGVEVRTGSRVTGIEVVEGGLRVRTATGADEAPQVLSAIGPRTTLLDLLDPMALPGITQAELSKVRLRGTWAKVHLALKGPLPVGGQMLQRVRTASHALDLERAFDDAKYGRLPSTPTVPLDLRVYDGGAGPVASILVRAPFHLREGWSDSARESLLQTVLASLEAHSPGVRDLIAAHQVLTPADLATEYGLEGGHLFHGEVALDQLWAQRPTPGLARYATPVKGLFLGSTGTSPGGPITGGPGLLAAQAMLS